MVNEYNKRGFSASGGIWYLIRVGLNAIEGTYEEVDKNSIYSDDF